MDASEIQETKASLERSETRYRTLFESSTDAIMLLDAKGFIDCNPATLRMFGLKSVDDFKTKHPAELSPPMQPCGTSSMELANKRIEQAFHKGVNRFEWVHQRSDGSEFPAEVWLTLMQLDGVPTLQATVRNISERKETQKQIHILSSAMKHAGASILITNKHGIIEYVNPAFEQLTGYSADEAIGQTPKLLNSGMQDNSFYADMWGTIKQGKIWRGRVVDKRKDGSLFPASLTISPILDAEGEISHYTHLVGIQSDLSELEKLEARCNQAQKMEAIGTLVGGIAHDFNNVLSGLTGNLYLTKKIVSNQPHALKKIESMEHLTYHASEMVSQLLTFARKNRIHLDTVDFRTVVETSLSLLRTTLPANIVLNCNLCEDTLQISGDGTQLHQVLMNLVNNARDAVEHTAQPSITIQLDTFQADRRFLAANPTSRVGLYACLSIADNGCGIPQSHVDKLFEPFFTTKEEGKGTGLGLSMVFGAIQTHKGVIEVESQEGKGSTFHLYIPLIKQEEFIANPTLPISERTISNLRNATILLVDDQEVIIDVGTEVLEDLGYRVVTATNGQEAIEVYQAQIEEIDLCIMDVVMPKMCGDEAAKRIRQINPHVKIIFATGYDKKHLKGMDNETVLNKPFRIEKLESMLQQYLS